MSLTLAKLEKEPAPNSSSKCMLAILCNQPSSAVEYISAYAENFKSNNEFHSALTCVPVYHTHIWRKISLFQKLEQIFTMEIDFNGKWDE